MKKYIVLTVFIIGFIFFGFGYAFSFQELPNYVQNIKFSLFDTMLNFSGPLASFILYLIAACSALLISILLIIFQKINYIKMVATASSFLNTLIFLIVGILTFCIVPLTGADTLGLGLGVGSICFAIANIILAIFSFYIGASMYNKICNSSNK